MSIKIVIAGASGRMGQALIQGVLDDAELQLFGAIDRAGTASIGRDAGEPVGKNTGVYISDDAAETLQGADALIDFTRPEACLDYLEICQRHHVKHVIGTTGFTVEQKAKIEAAAKNTAIVFAPNMSVGVTLLLSLVEQAAKVLNESHDAEAIGISADF